MSKVTRYYKHEIFPKINNRRGTTRLKKLLEDLALMPVEKFEGSPKSIYEYDDTWKNCIIIDACRLDLYRETYPEEDVKKRVTLGSGSPGYIRETYSEGDFSDVVMVTGNPYFSENKFKELTGRNPNDVFYEIFQTHSTDWIEEEGRPNTEAVIRDAKTAKKLFPDKKLVIHFMKPHHPFPENNLPDISYKLDGTYENSIWAHGEKENIGWKSVWRAYKDSLREIAPRVKELGNNLEGKSVITSDHGNLVGENNLGHHPGLTRKEKALREVPWLEL